MPPSRAWPGGDSPLPLAARRLLLAPAETPGEPEGSKRQVAQAEHRDRDTRDTAPARAPAAATSRTECRALQAW